jgi:hypothetical protein
MAPGKLDGFPRRVPGIAGKTARNLAHGGHVSSPDGSIRQMGLCPISAQVADRNRFLHQILNVRSINIAEKPLDFNRQMRS